MHLPGIARARNFRTSIKIVIFLNFFDITWGLHMFLYVFDYLFLYGGREERSLRGWNEEFNLLIAFFIKLFDSMSIYSGFATRSQEQYYDKILYNLISTLLLRLSKFYKREPVDQSIFLKIIFDHESTLRKMEKRKYLDPKYSKLLTIFKKQINGEDYGEEEVKEDKEQKSRAKETHELNRTLSLLGREFGELRVNAEKLDTVEHQYPLEEKESYPILGKIEERKKHVSKKKKKQKKASIKSNLDIWQARQVKPPELPQLHPFERTIMGKTKFNNFSERVRSKEIDDPTYDYEEEPESLRNVLAKPPKFRAKLYFK